MPSRGGDDPATGGHSRKESADRDQRWRRQRQPRTLPGILKLASESSAIIYTVGIFDSDDPDRSTGVLRNLARATGGAAFFPSETTDVVPICQRIARDIRNQYTSAMCPGTPGPPARTGKFAWWRTLPVTAGCWSEPAPGISQVRDERPHQMAAACAVCRRRITVGMVRLRCAGKPRLSASRKPSLRGVGDGKKITAPTNGPFGPRQSPELARTRLVARLKFLAWSFPSSSWRAPVGPRFTMRRAMLREPPCRGSG